MNSEPSAYGAAIINFALDYFLPTMVALLMVYAGALLVWWAWSWWRGQP